MRSGRPLMITVGLIMMICCPYRGHSQELPMVQTPSPVKGLRGQNLTIPCLLDNRELDLDLSKVGVRWSKMMKDGSEIDVYKFPVNNEEFRPGSFIDMKELKRGNASLTLPRVQISDEGEYTCTVIVTPKKGLAKIKVQLLAQPNVALSTTELTVEPGRKDSVTCEVSMFYPPEVKIRWGKYNKSSDSWSILGTKTYLTMPEVNSDGSFNVSSQLVVAPSSPGENGDVYSCMVKHASLSPNRNVTFTLTVKDFMYFTDKWIFYVTIAIMILSLGFLLATVWDLGRTKNMISEVTEFLLSHPRIVGASSIQEQEENKAKVGKLSQPEYTDHEVSQ